MDEIFLTTSKKKLFQYNPNCQCMANISDSIDERILKVRHSIREDAPLSVFFSHINGIYSWEFGPHQTGKYYLISNSVGFNELILRKGKFRLFHIEEVMFRIRYESPENWITYSPLFKLISNDAPVVWERN